MSSSNEFPRISKSRQHLLYLKLVKMRFFLWKCQWKILLLPPLKLTDLDKIFTGGISHYGLPPCKISSKSEHLKYQKLPSKIQNSWKKYPKIVFGPETLPWYGRHLWTMGWNSFRGLLVMPKKNLVALRAFFGCQITI